MTEQLQLDFDAVRSRLRDRVDRDRWRPLDGPTRLLLGLIRETDLDEGSLVAAAALSMELDLEALGRNGDTAAKDRELAAALALEANGAQR